MSTGPHKHPRPLFGDADRKPPQISDPARGAEYNRQLALAREANDQGKDHKAMSHMTRAYLQLDDAVLPPEPMRSILRAAGAIPAHLDEPPTPDPAAMIDIPPTCAVTDCETPARGRGRYCNVHYQRHRRHGDPLGGTTLQGDPMNYYLANVDRPTDDCITWPYRRSRGYGLLDVGGSTQGVHVLACERKWGPRPGPQFYAAHGPCHNPACFNPAHLSWRTGKQNAADRHRDGTAVTGEQSPTAKLTAVQAAAIRSEYAAGGVSQRQLGARYGLSQTAVRGVITGRTWAQ